MTTMYAFLNTLPELGGRVYRGTYAGSTPPATPYAILEDRQGGVAGPYSGGADTLIVSPCVTLYHKPGTGETPAQAVQALQLLANKVQQAHHSVDTHSDGVTPYISINRSGEFPPMADATVQGQSYLTVKFQALIYRS